MWIDALCINQDDTKERSHQFTQMGEIYRRDRQVISWLGTTDLTQTAQWRCDFLQSLERDFPAGDLVELRSGMTSSAPLAKLSFLTIPKSDVANQKLKEFLEFFRREYWIRLWILWEVNLATAAVLGIWIFRLWRSLGQDFWSA